MEKQVTELQQNTWQWDLLAGLLPLLALSPLLVYQVAELSSRDHMMFFPIAIALLCLLVVRQLWGATFSRDARRMKVAVALLIVAALSYAYGVWIFSPWLAHLALVLVFTAWGLGRLGHKHAASVLALSALLATTLPLPWGWDEGFSSWLQSSAAWCTAKGLDALAIPNLQNGSLVETRDLQVVADEVCGGLSSVYAFAAFAIALSLLQHTSFLVGLMTLVLVPVWTLLGHFLRMFGMLTIQEYWGRDFSSGWDFRMLEVATSLIVLLLIWSSNRFFRRMFEPIPVADAEFGPVFSGLNKLFCWPQPDPFEDLEPDDEYERQRFRKRKQEQLAKRQRPDFLWTGSPATIWSVRVAVMLLLICAALPVSSLARQGLGQLNFGRPDYSLAQVERLADEQSLPATLDGGWQRRGFQIVQRNSRSRQGEFSLMWRYGLEERQFDASIDLPFLGWNDPASNLELQGWKVEQSRIRWQDGWPWTESVLENELGGKAIIFHSLFTRSGEPFSNVPRQFRDSPSSDGDNDDDDDDSQPLVANSQTATTITYQIQLFSETGIDLPDAERQALLKQFLQLRKSALQLVQS